MVLSTEKTMLDKFFSHKGCANLFGDKTPFNDYVDEMGGGGGQKMSIFVHALGIKTVHAGAGQKMAKFCLLLNAPLPTFWFAPEMACSMVVCISYSRDF